MRGNLVVKTNIHDLYDKVVLSPFNEPCLKVAGSEPDEYQLWGKLGYISTTNGKDYVAVLFSPYRGWEKAIPFPPRHYDSYRGYIEVPKYVSHQFVLAEKCLF